MVFKLLPFLIGSILHSWNADNNIQLLRVTSADSQYVQLTDPREYIEYAATVNGAVSVEASPAVHQWMEIQGVTFYAKTPKQSWRVPLSGATGLLIATAEDAQITFTFRSKTGFRYTATGMVPAFQTVAFFTARLFTGDSDELQIDSDRPIGVWATKCGVRCIAQDVD